MDRPADVQTDHIKYLIGEGKTEEAIDALLDLPALDDALRQSALMLRNRWNALEREVVEGLVDRRDVNLEQARMTRGLLELLEQWEDGHATPRQPPAVAPPVRPAHAPWRWPLAALITLGVLGAVAAYLVFKRGQHDAPAAARTILLQLTPDDPAADPAPRGRLWVQFARDTVGPLLVRADDEWLAFRLPSGYEMEDARLDLRQLQYRYEVVDRQARRSGDTLRVRALLRAQPFRVDGRIVYTDGQPAVGIRVVFGDELAEATTDAQGRYRLSFPHPNRRNQILVTLYQDERELMRRQLLLAPEVLAELKIRR